MKQKIKTKREIKEILDKEKQEGKIIVTTNGTFDIVHLGHLRLLERAKSIGDILVVLVNSDSSVKMNKGDKRPIISQKERAEFLTYLSSVDYVTIFPDKTPASILSYLKPNIHVKGGSYLPEKVEEERKTLESFGGRYRIFSLEEDYSTTNLIKKIIGVHKDEAI